MIGKFTLANFYHSREWERLVAQLRLDRQDADGNIICAHCGKPIVKMYDCIGHHTMFLTEDNVNDINISLNPDLIQLVHHRCHNRIHDKLGYNNREVFLVWGSPLSGKTTFVDDTRSVGDLVVDIDNMWECVSGSRYLKPNKLKSVVFGMRDYLMDCVKVRRGKWDKAYIIGGFPLISDRERILKEYGAREIFISTTKEECIARLDACDDGRDKEAWRGYIDEWWRLSKL